MRTAINLILRRHGRCYQHKYEKEWQLLDVDVTGMPAGRLGEGVTKGYFAGEKIGVTGSWVVCWPPGTMKL